MPKKTAQNPLPKTDTEDTPAAGTVSETVASSPATPIDPSVSKDKENSEGVAEKVVEEPKKSDVPSVDANAPLKIDQITKKNSVPTTNMNASLKVEDEDLGSFNNEDNPMDKSRKKIFILGMIVSVAVFLISSTLLFFYVINFSREKKPAVSVRVETKKNKVEKKKTLVKNEWSFEVLNGSGIAGEAKRVADQLEALGYTVLKTGNADSKDYKKTQIFVSSEKNTDEAKLMLEDLKKEINISSSSGYLTDSTASARIIVGKE